MELFKKVQEIHGAILEWEYTRRIADALHALSTNSRPDAINRSIIGFDYLLGITGIDPENDPNRLTRRCSRDTTGRGSSQMIEAKTGAPGHPHSALRTGEGGDIARSAPEFVKSNAPGPRRRDAAFRQRLYERPSRNGDVPRQCRRARCGARRSGTATSLARRKGAA